MAEPPVTIEFFGVARLRAGRAEVVAEGRTVADLLRGAIRQCPNLSSVFTNAGALSRQFLISLDGERFVDDPAERVPAGSRLLVLGADAGG